MIRLCFVFYFLHKVKGIVHFEIKIWYLSAYPKGIQDVGVFFSSVDPILIFLGQTVLVCQSYNGRYRSLSLSVSICLTVTDVCVRALWLTLISHGASASTLDGGRV